MKRNNRKPQALNQVSKKVDMDKNQHKTWMELEKRKLKQAQEHMQIMRTLPDRLMEIFKTDVPTPKKPPRYKYFLHYGAQAIESAGYICIILVTLKMFGVI